MFYRVQVQKKVVAALGLSTFFSAYGQLVLDIIELSCWLCKKSMCQKMLSCSVFI